MKTRFEELEAYRGIAALGIILFHAYQSSRILFSYVYEGTLAHILLRNFDAGVSIFFVLSGFVVSLPVIQDVIAQERPRSSKGFLKRRLLRIVPLYFVAIILVWSARFSGSAGEWVDLIEHLTFTQIFDNSRIFSTIGPAWSLALEILFYVWIAAVGPLMYWLCRSVPARRDRVMFVTICTTLTIMASVGYKWWAAYVALIPDTNYEVYYGFFAKLDTFSLGILLSIVWASVRQKPFLDRVTQMLFLLFGFELLGFTFLLRPHYAIVDLYFHTLCAVSFAFLLMASRFGRQEAWGRRLLNSAHLQFLGLISYSLYLWHEPILIFVQQQSLVQFTSPQLFPVSTLALVVLSLIGATVSYYLIERPTMLLKHLFDEHGNPKNHYE